MVRCSWIEKAAVDADWSLERKGGMDGGCGRRVAVLPAIIIPLREKIGNYDPRASWLADLPVGGLAIC